MGVRAPTRLPGLAWLLLLLARVPPVLCLLAPAVLGPPDPRSGLWPVVGASFDPVQVGTRRAFLEALGAVD